MGGFNNKRPRNGLGQFEKLPTNGFGWAEAAGRAALGVGMRYGAPWIMNSLFSSNNVRNRIEQAIPGGSTQVKTKKGACIIQQIDNTEYKDTVPAYLSVGKPVGPMNPFSPLLFFGKSHRFESQNAFKASHSMGLSSCTWIDCRSFTENSCNASFSSRDVKKTSTSTDAELPVSFLTCAVGASGSPNTYDRSQVLVMGNTCTTPNCTKTLLKFSNCMNSCVQNYFPPRSTTGFNMIEYQTSKSPADNSSPCHINYERGSMKFDITSVANHPVNHAIYMFTMDREFCEYYQIQGGDWYDFDSIWANLIAAFQLKYFSSSPEVPVFGNQTGSGTGTGAQFTARADMTAEDYVNASGPIPAKFLSFIAKKGLRVAKVFEVQTKAGQRSTVNWKLGGLHLTPQQYSTSEDSNSGGAQEYWRRFNYYYPGSCVFMHRQWGVRMAVNRYHGGGSTYLGAVDSPSSSIIQYTHVEHMSLAPTVVVPRINAEAASPDVFSGTSLTPHPWTIMNPPVVSQTHVNNTGNAFPSSN